MSLNKFSRSRTSKEVGWDLREIASPSLETIIALEKQLDSPDPEIANGAIVRIFEYYRFMEVAIDNVGLIINNRICRICRERLE